jgi:hypothetical protein
VLGFADASQFLDLPDQPHAATLSASGEGIYFTGAPRFAGRTCLDCHTGGPGLVRLKLGADTDELFNAGYRPGRTYELEVELLNEVRGLNYTGATCTEAPAKSDTSPYVQCNNNGYALEIDTASGPLGGPGVYCAVDPNGASCPAPDPTADETVVTPAGDAVFGARAHDAMNPQQVIRNDPTRWHLFWTAPHAGTGPLTVYLAVVDGNGGDGTADDDQDPDGDDTVQASIPLRELGAPLPQPATAGCSLGGDFHPQTGPFVLCGLLALVFRWRRRVEA